MSVLKDEEGRQGIRQKVAPLQLVVCVFGLWIATGAYRWTWGGFGQGFQPDP